MKLNLPVRSYSRHERGQSLVELAISLTVMLLLLSGAVTFGMALFSYVALRDAAQEGALYGSFNPYLDTPSSPNGQYDAGEAINTDVIRARVRAASDSPVRLSDTSIIPDGYITVETMPSGAPPCEGTTSGDPNAIRVRVEYDYPIIMPFVGAITGPNIHLRAEVTDTILEPRCP